MVALTGLNHSHKTEYSVIMRTPKQPTPSSSLNLASKRRSSFARWSDKPKLREVLGQFQFTTKFDFSRPGTMKVSPGFKFVPAKPAALKR